MAGVLLHSPFWLAGGASIYGLGVTGIGMYKMATADSTPHYMDSTVDLLNSEAQWDFGAADVLDGLAFIVGGLGVEEAGRAINDLWLARPTVPTSKP